MVVNSFDLWKMDTFFSAAEEVQQSADMMESTYRMWVRERRKGESSEDLDQLSKDLQTVLGTAKWQLEEFERAVSMSIVYLHENNPTVRHKQFIEAIEHQISRVESSLAEFFVLEGKKSLSWVNLDEEDCDDLAMFLCGSFKNTPGDIKNGLLHNGDEKIDGDSSFNTTSTDCIIDIDETDSPVISEDIISQAERTSTKRIKNSPNYSSLRITIPEDENNELMENIEATPKEKGLRTFLWKQSRGEHRQANVVVIYLTRLWCRLSILQRQLQSTTRPVLALLLTVILAVIFLLYLA